MGCVCFGLWFLWRQVIGLRTTGTFKGSPRLIPTVTARLSVFVTRSGGLLLPRSGILCIGSGRSFRVPLAKILLEFIREFATIGVLWRSHGHP